MSTNIGINSQEYKTLFLDKIQEINTPEAKAILPFFKKHSPIEAYQAIRYSQFFIRYEGKDDDLKFQVTSIRDGFLHFHSYIHKFGIFGVDDDLANIIDRFFSDSHFCYSNDAIKKIIDMNFANKDLSVDRNEVAILINLLNVASAYCSINLLERNTPEEIYSIII